MSQYLAIAAEWTLAVRPLGRPVDRPASPRRGIDGSANLSAHVVRDDAACEDVAARHGISGGLVAVAAEQLHADVLIENDHAAMATTGIQDWTADRVIDAL
ncbi:hypothetical protein ACFVRB_36645 [Streptomyces nojiriensis]|uniref:hypothetical protein n=1 Tax=Streptomyces nojiriensis TaxID=66374 RepID=UPI0036DB855C